MTPAFLSNTSITTTQSVHRMQRETELMRTDILFQQGPHTADFNS